MSFKFMFSDILASWHATLNYFECLEVIIIIKYVLKFLKMQQIKIFSFPLETQKVGMHKEENFFARTVNKKSNESLCIYFLMII